MKRSILIITILAIILGGVYYFYNRGKGGTLPNWKTAKVEKGTLIQYVTATGALAADTTVQVGTQVSGIIAKILVDFNSVVKYGQVVAVLDTTFLYASKEDASASLQKASVQTLEMKREFDRTKTLFDQKVTDQADYDLAEYNLESARSGERSAKAQYNRAVINLQYATIKAPVSGTVISRNVDVGQTVISSFNAPTLFSIANDLTKMQVQANVDEADIGQVKVGQEVEFTVDAYADDLFHGRVQQIRIQPVNVQNVVNYVVIVDVPNKDGRLLPGLTANIRIRVNSRDSILKVPVNALHFNPPVEYPGSIKVPDSILRKSESLAAPPQEDAHKKTFVIWVKSGAFVYPIRVKAGISDGLVTEVSGNLKSGDEVAIGVLTTVVTGAAPKSPFMPAFQSRKRTP
ncbi:MAG TPA: efflux RND transporter periplasmic adaptor subunit [Bacteroidia bacterium]|jgi:HlyD family secretion protein|nr:efflux RND transporter periplasmic adaptor subunit [Bacteroidia bacterium]